MIDEFEKWIQDKEKGMVIPKKMYGWEPRKVELALTWQASAANEREKMVKQLREPDASLVSAIVKIMPLGATPFVTHENAALVCELIADHLEKE